MAARHLGRMLLPALVFAVVGPGWAQRPSQAQIGAIRQSCAADFEANCQGVAMSGQPALACLRQHSASLSAGCGEAVSAIGPGGGMPAETAPPAEAPGGAPGAAPPQVFTPLPATPPAAPLPQVYGPQTNPRAARGGALRSACGADYRRVCAGTQAGGGRALACLNEHREQLSPGCTEALAARPVR